MFTIHLLNLLCELNFYILEFLVSSIDAVFMIPQKWFRIQNSPREILLLVHFFRIAVDGVFIKIKAKP